MGKDEVQICERDKGIQHTKIFNLLPSPRMEFFLHFRVKILTSLQLTF